MASERESEEISVPLPSSEDASLQATWGLGNQLFVYAADRRPAKDTNGEGSDMGHTQSYDILDLRWGQDMHGPTTRKLINESHSVFVMLQGQVTSLSGSALYNQLKEASRQYRSIAKACSLELQLLMSNTVDEGEREYYGNQVELLETMQIIWSLCEILFIDIAPGEMVLVQLLNWVRWHFSAGREMAQDVINDEIPEEHPAYWEAIFRLLLQGEIERVRKLLSLHSCSQTQPFTSVEELLKKMPQWGNLRTVSLAEFDLKWRHWREECMRRYEEGHFTAFAELERVVQVLCGDMLVFSELKDYCETWYHLLISRLLYQNPTVRPTDLAFHVQACMEEFQRAGHRMGHVDNILQAALEFDLHQVIKDSSTSLGDRSWWFGAHLTDILHHCGQIDSQKLPFGSNLREYLLLEYVAGLMSHHSLWQVGVDYLDHCPVFGKEHMKLYIENLPLDSERKANKLIHICEERDLLEQVQSICKIMGVRCSQDGRLGSALSWFLRSKDVPAATRLTEKFLQDYKENGNFSHLDLLDHMGPTMLLTQQLTFLGKYREFHRMYQEKDLKGAASLLLSMLTARAAPRHFWVTLLMDALPLLETPQVILGTSQTYELMHCLEELTQDLTRNTPTSTTPSRASSTPTPQSAGTGVTAAGSSQILSQRDLEKLKLLRLALCRNLSRSIVHEGTIVPL
ncbi:nuclear pore complex protein Nup85-like [Littorina saxatilis]|uniref:Nuclear pore complex protein Nup85 n=1 Tax=Littorina saxatilis TaxID=31220 RepID=A0AAN9GKG7_9CAEN